MKKSWKNFIFFLFHGFEKPAEPINIFSMNLEAGAEKRIIVIEAKDSNDAYHRSKQIVEKLFPNEYRDHKCMVSVPQSI